MECLTLVGLHRAQTQLVHERDGRLGVTFDLVMKGDRVGPAGVVPSGAADLRVRGGGHVAGHAIHGDGNKLRVGTEPGA